MSPVHTLVNVPSTLHRINQIWISIKNICCTESWTGFVFPLISHNVSLTSVCTDFVCCRETGFGPGKAIDLYNCITLDTRHSDFKISKVCPQQSFSLFPRNIQFTVLSSHLVSLHNKRSHYWYTKSNCHLIFVFTHAHTQNNNKWVSISDALCSVVVFVQLTE